MFKRTMSTPYTNTKRRVVSNTPTKLQSRLKRTIYLAAAGISIMAMVSLVNLIREQQVVEVEDPYPHGTLSVLSVPETFIAAYLAVNCPSDLLEKTQTIRVSGKMISDEQSHPFTLIKKRPDQTLMTIDLGAYEMTVGVTGEQVWRRIRVPQQADQYTLVEGEEATTWQEQGRFFDRIISTSLGEGSLTTIATTQWNAQTCLGVTTQDTDQAPVTTVVDPQTLYPLAELQTLPDGTIKQTVFDDYRVISGMPIPFTITTSTPDQPHNTIQIQQAALNPGVLSKLFDLPEPLVQ
jgi:hypothetical protein